jgi:hypothetical protein
VLRKLDAGGGKGVQDAKVPLGYSITTNPTKLRNFDFCADQTQNVDCRSQEVLKLGSSFGDF